MLVSACVVRVPIHYVMSSWGPYYVLLMLLIALLNKNARGTNKYYQAPGYLNTGPLFRHKGVCSRRTSTMPPPHTHTCTHLYLHPSRHAAAERITVALHFISLAFSADDNGAWCKRLWKFMTSAPATAVRFKSWSPRATAMPEQSQAETVSDALCSPWST